MSFVFEGWRKGKWGRGALKRRLFRRERVLEPFQTISWKTGDERQALMGIYDILKWMRLVHACEEGHKCMLFILAYAWALKHVRMNLSA